jgi:hypothetical protein
MIHTIDTEGMIAVMGINLDDLILQREESENQIRNPATDFMTRYYAVCHLQMMARDHTRVLTAETVSVLKTLLKNKTYACQRRGFILFRQTAETLATVIIRSPIRHLAVLARKALDETLKQVTGYAHRTSAEALGSLPIKVKGPDPGCADITVFPRVSWQELLLYNGLEAECDPQWLGRSLVAPSQNGKLIVLKLARKENSPQNLVTETLWLEHLKQAGYRFNVRFNIPEVLYVKEAPIFRVRNLPLSPSADLKLHPRRLAIAFLAHKDYFNYPNDHRTHDKTGKDDFKRIMFQNAYLLGHLAALGMVHSAPIPLFHNRIQRQRRRDHGLYEWFRAGRLDRWLDSCNYPNLGKTGLRDFEHMISFNDGPLSLYRYIGSHFLSLLLVSGSYFRNQCAEKVGFDENGRPIDARDLFDTALLTEIVNGIFKNYYRGFAGAEYQNPMPFDLCRLVERMVEEMGVDRHMEEILRVHDQEEMSDGEFRTFLARRGYDTDEIDRIRKGVAELVVHSGPHLGGFNRTISLPEIIESTAAMSAACIAGKYWENTFE